MEALKIHVDYEEQIAPFEDLAANAYALLEEVQNTNEILNDNFSDLYEFGDERLTMKEAIKLLKKAVDKLDEVVEQRKETFRDELEGDVNPNAFALDYCG